MPAEPGAAPGTVNRATDASTVTGTAIRGCSVRSNRAGSGSSTSTRSRERNSVRTSMGM